MEIWKSFNNWLRKKPKTPQPIFSRVKVENDPWVLEAWQGVLKLSNLEYLVILRFIRPIGDLQTPYKHFKDATHHITIWCYFDREGKRVGRVLYNRQLNFGHWKLEEFESQRSQWQHPAEYKAMILSLDNCGRSITREVLTELENCQDLKLITYSKITENYWNIVISNAASKCPGISKPTTRGKMLTNGKQVWYDDSDDFSVS
jgi:hypothetical protein